MLRLVPTRTIVKAYKIRCYNSAMLVYNSSQSHLLWRHTQSFTMYIVYHIKRLTYLWHLKRIRKFCIRLTHYMCVWHIIRTPAASYYKSSLDQWVGTEWQQAIPWHRSTSQICVSRPQWADTQWTCNCSERGEDGVIGTITGISVGPISSRRLDCKLDIDPTEIPLMPTLDDVS